MNEPDIYSRLDQIISRKKDLLYNFENKNRKQDLKEFMSVYNYCLDSLKPEYRFILLESFLDVSYKYWWLDYYCQSSFYRKRLKAVSSFVHLFETIYENFDDYSDIIDIID